MTSSKAGKKRKADIQKAQEVYEEKKRNKRLQAALTDSMRALPSSQETFKNCLINGSYNCSHTYSFTIPYVPIESII